MERTPDYVQLSGSRHWSVFSGNLHWYLSEVFIMFFCNWLQFGIKADASGESPLAQR